MKSISTVLEWLLNQGSRGNFLKVESLHSWKEILASQSAEWSMPMERAIIFGFKADRVAYAFLSGFRAALQSLIPTLNPASFVAFCITEEAGNSPKAINSHLSPGVESGKSGQYRLNGEKTFITGALEADTIFVIAMTGIDESGRKTFKLVKLNSKEPGIVINPMKPLPFIPEILHGKVRFENVIVSEADVLPGDGYSDYVKPFRIVEEIHVMSAIVAYLIRLAFEYQWDQKLVEKMTALLVMADRLSAMDLKSAITHITFAGFRQNLDQLLEELEPCWEVVVPEVKNAWHRDRAILSIAQSARDIRLKNAWRTFTEKHPTLK